MWNKPTEEELARLPDYRIATDMPLEEIVIHMRFYIGNCYWLIAGYKPSHRMLFGFANLGDDQMAEWGAIPLKDLEEINIEGVEVNRDLFWEPTRFVDIPKCGTLIF